MLSSTQCRTLLAAAAVVLLAACDSSPAAGPDPLLTTDVAPGTYAAQVTGGANTVRLAGTAEASQANDGADFTGTFQSYPLGGAGASGFHFTMIRLRSGDGGGLVLGHVAPNPGLPNGEFGVEPGRDLRAPYDFVARLIEIGENGVPRYLAARSGRVIVTAGDTRLGGRFELVLEDGRTVTGTFAAITRR
jgi:hypothetical protein